MHVGLVHLYLHVYSQLLLVLIVSTHELTRPNVQQMHVHWLLASLSQTAPSSYIIKHNEKSNSSLTALPFQQFIQHCNSSKPKEFLTVLLSPSVYIYTHIYTSALSCMKDGVSCKIYNSTCYINAVSNLQSVNWNNQLKTDKRQHYISLVWQIHSHNKASYSRFKICKPVCIMDCRCIYTVNQKTLSFYVLNNSVKNWPLS